MTDKEFVLSEKIRVGDACDRTFIYKDDVKEFIKRLKDVIRGWNDEREVLREIDKLAGEKFVGEKLI